MRLGRVRPIPTDLIDWSIMVRRKSRKSNFFSGHWESFLGYLMVSNSRIFSLNLCTEQRDIFIWDRISFIHTPSSALTLTYPLRHSDIYGAIYTSSKCWNDGFRLRSRVMNENVKKGVLSFCGGRKFDWSVPILLILTVYKFSLHLKNIGVTTRSIYFPQLQTPD